MKWGNLEVGFRRYVVLIQRLVLVSMVKETARKRMKMERE